MVGNPVRFAVVLPLALVFAQACDLTETCDPDVDPNCTYFDAGNDGSGTGCGPLGEGQTRCIDANSMEACRDGRLQVDSCTGECREGACTDALRYVRIVDSTLSLSGQHPGADIDAVALETGGQTFFATQVTDSFIPTDVPSRARNVNEILGPPDHGDSCDLSDNAEHWISLAGGEIVVTFGRPIASGDRITVYECAGAANDQFDLTIGVSDRIEGDWQVLLTEASGTISATVP